jgi:predicted cupin superfamily sugar epimerase
MHPDVRAIIAHYGLVPLPSEETLYAPTYRSTRELDIGKPFGTAMIGLYADDPPSRSLFHRLPVDEVWHFYAGDPLRLVLLEPGGTSRDVIMGSEPLRGHVVQLVVPAGAWQAGHMVEGGRYSLFGCTLAPGFTGDMFEGGTREALLRGWPDRARDIERLGCDPDQVLMPEGFSS